MPIKICPTHNLPQLVICCQGECLRLYCSQCFIVHNKQHSTGVILSELSKNALIEWNQFLIQKFRQIFNTIKAKGVNIIYEMRLNPNYPKGLINQLSNNEMVECATKVFEQYTQTLIANIQFISTRQSIDQLVIPELFKDLFIFCVYDAGSGLYFLQQKTINLVKTIYNNKTIYDYVQLMLTPRQQRNLQQKRKSIVNNIQQQTIIRIKKDNVITSNSPNRSRIYQIQKEKESPKKNTLLSQKRMRSYNENYSGNNQSQSPPIQTNRNLNNKQQIKIAPTQNSLSKDLNKKIEEAQSQKIQLKNEIINPNAQKQQVLELKQQVKVEQKVQLQEEDIKKQNLQVRQLQEQKQVVQQPKTQKTQQKNQTQPNEDQVQQIKNLQQKLKQKQLSIRQLNNVISNEQQQIQCRQNQVQMLNQQIKKLQVYKQKYQALQEEVFRVRKQLQFKQKSINQLNKLIGNEEQQLQFRESQVQTLTTQIKKLVEWKQRCQQIQEKLNLKEKQLNQRERGIKQLNNVIDNEAQQLAFRQNQVQMLTSQLKKASQSKIQHEKTIQDQSLTIQTLKKEKQQLEISLKISQQNLRKQRQNKQLRQQQSFDEQLLQQTIQLQSQVCARNFDIKNLVQILNNIQTLIPEQKRPQIIEALKNLKTIQLSF